MRIRSITIAAVLVFCAPFASQAAEKYPVDRMRIVMPFPAGGAADMIARELGHRLESRLGIPIIIENRVGASGIIGSDNVARSKPDGGSLLLVATHHVINPTLQKTLPYDTKKDFTPLALVATSVNAIAVNPKVPATTLQELIDLAKKEPTKITYGSTGTGGANHLAGELFRSMAGIDIQHIPFPGSPQAMNAVIGGHIVMIVNALPTILPYVPNKELRLLAVTSKDRVPSLPDVPTVDESGVKGFEALSWFGIYGPAGMSPELVKQITDAITDSLRSPELKASFEKMGIEPGNLTGEAYKEFVFSEIDKWGKVVKDAGLEPK